VDAQIACIFIPYIAAVPVSHLPSGSLLWTAAAACTVGTIATMFVAGKVAQAFENASSIGDTARDGEQQTEETQTSAISAAQKSRPRRMSAADAARAVCGDTPPEGLWLVATVALAPLALIPWVELVFHHTAAPAYVCATAATYLLARRVPNQAQRLGLAPTVTGGVAMACVASLVGWLTGVGAEAGIQDYLAGAGALYLYFVPPAVLGLAFRVRAQAETLRKNAKPLALAVAVAVPGGLLLGAALGRAVGLPPDVVLASLPKCTTTGLAVHMAAALGGNPSLAAAGCALSATIGLSAGRALMDAMNIRGATARGAATGVSSHAAGTAALAAAGEDAAAAVSGVVFALSGVFGVLLLEIPRFRAALLAVAGA
jgi:putative effector of murein hydrolase